MPRDVDTRPPPGSMGLPRPGIGARVTVAKANHVNARADAAFSKEGVTFYFSVGEAF